MADAALRLHRVGERRAVSRFGWLLAALMAWGPGLAHALPTYDEVRADFRPSDTLILSREGEVVQRLRTDATVVPNTLEHLFVPSNNDGDEAG